MVGNDPYNSPSAASVTYQPIIMVVTINGVTYDPQQPACNDPNGTSVADRFFASPLFNPMTYNVNGTSITGQYISAFQQANFWAVAGSKAAVTLAQGNPPTVVKVNLAGTNLNLSCSNGKAIHLGEVDINTFDAAVQSAIAQANVPPNELPVVLTYNIVQTQSGQCCILGYHNAVPVSNGVLTYATGAYVDSGIFSNTDDVTVWSHEMGEWMDDPFVQANVPGGGSNDITPKWGRIGQVSGCQNNLEVGDPLTGTETAYTLNGFTYHVQDLAYKDWFYGTASQAPGGTGYSFLGTFNTPASACHGK